MKALQKKNLHKKVCPPKFFSYMTYLLKSPLKPQLSVVEVVANVFWTKIPNLVTLKTSTKPPLQGVLLVVLTLTIYAREPQSHPAQWNSYSSCMKPLVPSKNSMANLLTCKLARLQNTHSHNTWMVLLLCYIVP